MERESKIKLDDKFKETYTELIEEFKQKISDIKPDNALPRPFIPAYGKNYENSDFKIAFMGRDNNHNSDLLEFLKNPEDQLYVDDVINNDDEYVEFLEEWYNSRKNGAFWNFILRFIAAFYNIEDWRDLYNTEKHYEKLTNFVYGNVNTIYLMNPKADYEKWFKVREASKIFDNAKYILNIFQPKIMLVLHWNEDDSWLLENYQTEVKKIDNKLDYYYIKETNTHVLWTAHPRYLYMARNTDAMIYKILKKIKEEKIFKSFPGEEFLEKMDYRTGLFRKLKEQLKTSAMRA